MSWSAAKARFEQGLELANSHANRVIKGKHDIYAKTPIFSPQEKNQLLQKVEMGKQFLVTLKAIKVSYPNVSEEFLAGFLDSATGAIASWSISKPQTALFHSKLTTYSNDLQEKLNSYVRIPEDNKSNCEFAVLSGGISLALIGIVSIAVGPWGLLAVAVAGLVASLVFAMVSGYRMHKNSQVVDFQPIVKFVQEFDPTGKKAEKQSGFELSESDDSSSENVSMPC